MSKFTDNLWRDLVREHGSALREIDRPGATSAHRAAVVLRPRVLAGSTLALAGAATAVLLFAVGVSSPPAAFAVTRASDGSIVVRIDYVKNETFTQANAKLKAMGTDEQIGAFQMATGAAAAPGPVTCGRAWGPDRPSGPAVKVLIGSNGTEVIGPGQSGGNTAEGSFHMQSCVVENDEVSDNSGEVPAPVASQN